MNSSNQFIRIITDEFNDSKLIGWLKKYYPDYPYTLLCKLVRKGNIRVNGSRCETNRILKLNDKIKIPSLLKQNKHEHKVKTSKYLEEKIKSLILYKDDEIMVINKPNGLAVQGGSKVKTSIDNILQTLKFEKKERPRLVHRLDKDTSGLLMVARTKNYANFYTDLFKKRIIKKVYLAIVYGESKLKTGKINVDIETNNKIFDACTNYQTLSKNKLYSLLLIFPKTGRKHQIRKHLFSIKHPIVGDRKYTNEKGNNRKHDLNLHAFLINFKNINGIEKLFHAEIPDHMKKNLANFNLDYKFQGLDFKKIFYDNNIWF